MIILLDFSQIVVSESLEYFRRTGEAINMQLLRHLTLSQIMFYRKKFGKNIVICCDGKNYWRKDIFPNYKQNRKKGRDESKFDWSSFYTMLNELKKEFSIEIPLKLIEIPGCETDDIIATLCDYLCGKNITIVSSDKDFLQIPLTICKSVTQWSPKHKTFIDANDMDYNLLFHIIKGDDGVPNILTENDSVFLMPGERCVSITKKFLQSCLKNGDISNPSSFLTDEDVIKRFERNRLLIDLRQTPQHLKDEIVKEYQKPIPEKINFYDYCIKHQLLKILNKGLY